MKVAWEAGRDRGLRWSLATVSCVGGRLRSRVTEVTKEAQGLAMVGREGGLTTAAINGRSVATKIVKEAVAMEGPHEAWRRTSLWRIATANAAMNVMMEDCAEAR